MVWVLDPLEVRETLDFQRESVRLIILQKSDAGFCVLRNEVAVLDLAGERVRDMESLRVKTLRKMTDGRVSEDETMLAVAYEEDAENLSEIRIFKIEQDLRLTSLVSIVEISTPVEIMDFTKDNTYLMYKEVGLQQVYFDLLNLKSNDALGQLFDPPFMTSGLALSPSVSQLSILQNEENQITCMVLAGRRTLIAGDQLGTIRLFEFPCKSHHWSKIYTDHLGPICSLKVSKNEDWAMSVSYYDR